MIVIFTVSRPYNGYVSSGMQFCHFLGCAGEGQFVYHLGFGWFDPSSGLSIPDTLVNVSTPPKTVASMFPGENDVYHDNIRGIIRTAGYYPQSGGRLYIPTLQPMAESMWSAYVKPGRVGWSNPGESGVSSYVPYSNRWANGSYVYHPYPDSSNLNFPETENFNYDAGGRLFNQSICHFSYNGSTWTVSGHTSYYQRVPYDISYSHVLPYEKDNQWWTLIHSVGPKPADFVGYWPLEVRSYVYPVPVGTLSSYLDSGLSVSDVRDLAMSHLVAMKSAPYEGLGPTLQAVKGFDSLDINNLENSRSLSLQDILPIKAIKTLKKNPVKGMADLFLWYKYSFIPNISDAKQILAAWDRLNDDLSRVKKRYGTVYGSGSYKGSALTTRYNSRVIGSLQCRTEMETLSHRIRGLGLSPSLANLWDLVPFSFIVDWVLPIGDALEEVGYETANLFHRYDISSVCSSERTECTIPASLLSPSATGALTLIRYRRINNSTLPPNQLNLGAKDPSRHVFEGAALAISNWR